MRIKIGNAAAAVLAAALALGIGAGAVHADARTVKASLSGKQVRIGKQLSVNAGTKGVRYQSSNTAVASISDSGVITGKKTGSVTITVKKSGYKPKKWKIKVKAVKGKPSLDVAPDEIKLVSPKMKKTGEQSYQYSAVIKNTAKAGKVQQIRYYYQVRVREKVSVGATGASATKKESAGVSQTPASPTAEAMPTATATATTAPTVTAAPAYAWTIRTKTVVLAAKNIGSGKKSSRVSCVGDLSGKISAMHLTKIELCAGDALYTYKVSSHKGILKWSPVDVTGPEITGWVGKKSVYNGDPIRVCYTDKKNTYQFKDHVKAVDARDGKVTVTVDTSKIKWNKEGIYKVYYTAKDKSGNQTKTWAKVRVYKPGTAEKIADLILSTSIKSGSDVQRLRSIYKYVTGHCSYVGGGSHKNWRATAVKGIRNHAGDCFTFYSMSRLLITRAGIPNIMIRRYPAHAGKDHWWNLVYVKGGWYHFDATPRSRPGYFCLQTDEQLDLYSTGYVFRFREKLYPKRAKKKISRDPV